MARKQSGGTPATAALTAAGVAFTLHPYAHADGERHFGDEATAALGLDPARVFKTLVADVGSGRSALAVAVVPGRPAARPQGAGRARSGAKKAAMADPAAAQRSSGYVLGGISPLGQRTALPTVVDASALDLRDRLRLGGPSGPAGRAGARRPGRRHRRAGGRRLDVADQDASSDRVRLVDLGVAAQRGGEQHRDDGEAAARRASAARARTVRSTGTTSPGCAAASRTAKDPGSNR